MQPHPSPTTPSGNRRLLRRRGGMTLIEVMLAASMFTIAAAALIATHLYSRRLAESNLCQAIAQTHAQSIIEQVIRLSPTMLSDTTETDIAIKVPVLTSNNYTTMKDVSVPWSTNATTYTDIGFSSEGVLVDAAYIAATKTIHPERYMKMRVNLQRTVEDSENRVRIVLRYQWLPRSRQKGGNESYLSDEIRTVRSLALRY